jgi:hypothetical protein
MSRSLQRPTQAEQRRCAPPRLSPTKNDAWGVLTTRTATHRTVRYNITLVSFPPDAPRQAAHYCVATGARLGSERTAQTQPHRYLSLFPLCLAVDPHFCRHNDDGNQMLTQRCHTGPPARHRKKAGQLTQFSLTDSCTNYKCSALIHLLCESRSGSQTVTAKQARDTPGHWATH